MDNQIGQKEQEIAVDIKRILNVRQFRESSIIESGKIDRENRTVDLSFSSEVAVKRWFGMEILDHNLALANLSRPNLSSQKNYEIKTNPDLQVISR